MNGVFFFPDLRHWHLTRSFCGTNQFPRNLQLSLMHDTICHFMHVSRMHHCNQVLQNIKAGQYKVKAIARWIIIVVITNGSRFLCWRIYDCFLFWEVCPFILLKFLLGKLRFQCTLGTGRKLSLMPIEPSVLVRGDMNVFSFVSKLYFCYSSSNETYTFFNFHCVIRIYFLFWQ